MRLEGHCRKRPVRKHASTVMEVVSQNVRASFVAGAVARMLETTSPTAAIVPTEVQNPISITSLIKALSNRSVIAAASSGEKRAVRAMPVCGQGVYAPLFPLVFTRAINHSAIGGATAICRYYRYTVFVVGNTFKES